MYTHKTYQSFKIKHFKRQQYITVV